MANDESASALMLVSYWNMHTCSNFGLFIDSARVPLGASDREAEQDIIEIYQPDGIHSLQEPPTEVPPIVF
jgi:hypothetical protein